MNKSYLIMVSALCITATGCKDKNETQETAPAKVETQTVKLVSADGAQNFSGTVEEMSCTALSFPMGGTIKHIYVSPGQMVGKGALLAEVDRTSLYNTYEGALAMRQQAEDAYKRLKMLHDNGSLPEVQWIEVQSKLKQAISSEQIAKKGLDDCKLYAPFGGYIAEKSAEVGSNMLPGAPLFKLVEINKVKVKISVPEDEIGHMKKGMKMNVTVPALDGRNYQGTVTETDVTANLLSRSYNVKMVIDNRDRSLLPGMICQVSAEADSTGNSVILLPSHLVQLGEDNTRFVWVNAGGVAQKRVIQTAQVTAHGVIVASGLNPGDQVIVKGQQKVSSGQKISTK